MTDDGEAPSGRRLLLVNGLSRSGTNLLVRCLDGHPDVFVIPQHIGILDVCPDFWLEAGALLDAPRLDRERMARVLCTGRPRGGYRFPLFGYHREAAGALEGNELVYYYRRGRSAGSSDQVYRFDFSWDRFFDHLEEAGGVRTAEGFLFTLASALQAGRGGRTLEAPFVAVSGANQGLRKLEAARSDELWRLLYIVRFPPRRVASLRRLRKMNPDESGTESALWRLSEIPRGFLTALREVRHVRGFADRTERARIVAYEDLLSRPEAVMRSVAEFLGLDYQPLLTRPTVWGRDVAANTSFGESSPDSTRIRPPRRKGLNLALRAWLAGLSALGVRD